MLLNVTVGGVLPWATIALMAGFMATIGFTFANATALALSEVRYAAGTGSAVLGFVQYSLGATVSPLIGLAGDANALPMGAMMLTAAALSATALFVLTRGHRPFRETSSAAAETHTPAAAALATSR